MNSAYKEYYNNQQLPVSADINLINNNNNKKVTFPSNKQESQNNH